MDEADHGTKKRAVEELTDRMMRLHYAENDVEGLLEHFDDEFSWIGAGEDEYAFGTDRVKEAFRSFAGNVLKCNLSDGEYNVLEIAPGAYLCTGRVWISTDPSTNAYIRVHQRISAVVRETEDGRLACCHIHVSNPYSEMDPSEMGFPTNMAQQTYEYLQEKIEEQRRQLEAQTAELDGIYNSVPCAIMRFARSGGKYTLLTANRTTATMVGADERETIRLDWSRGHSPHVVEEDVPAVEDALAKLREPGDSVDLVYRLRQEDGTVLHVSGASTFVARDERGDVIQRIAFDISDRIALEEALRRKSYEDSLTGVFNRAKFRELLRGGAYDDAERLNVAYVDVNGLKETNDRFGHLAGDELICQTAACIRRVFPGKTFRIGGDEFVVIDADLDAEVFERQVGKVMALLEDCGVSASVGLSQRTENADPNAQFEEADRLMYQEKASYYRQGGNDRRKGRG